MKKFLFAIIVILLTPIYLIIQFTIRAIEMIEDLTEPFADGMRELVENMTSFWKEIFNKGRGHTNEHTKKNGKNILKVLRKNIGQALVTIGKLGIIIKKIEEGNNYEINDKSANEWQKYRTN